MGTCTRRCSTLRGARSPKGSQGDCHTTYLELGSEDGVVVGRGMPWGCRKERQYGSSRGRRRTTDQLRRNVIFSLVIVVLLWRW